MILEHGTPQPTETFTGRTRLVIIGAVAVLAVAIGAVLGSLLVSGAGAALARSGDYVPRSAVMYMEVRLNLPGEQRTNLRAILDRFPAIDADDILTDALADTMDSALADGNAPFDYSTDIAPWFDGSMALAVLDIPSAADPMQMELPAVVGLFGVRDATAATSLTDTMRSELEAEGAVFSSSQHDGVTVWSMTMDRSAAMPMDAMGFGYAVAGDQLILGNGSDAVERALDAASSGGDRLSDDPEVARLLARLPEERIGISVVNSEAMMAPMRAALESAQPDMADALAPYLDAMPPINVGAVSLAADAIVFDSVSDVSTGPLATENASRDLAAHVPAGAILFADTAGLGGSLEQGVAALKSMLAAAPPDDASLEGLEQMEAALGADLEELVSWIGNGAVAAGWDGEQPYFGLLLQAVDATAAERRLAQLRALAELAASDAGSGIEVSSQDVAGVEVTTLRFTDATMTGDLPLAAAIQYALRDDLVLIGMGDRFVSTALALDPGASLANGDRYQGAMGRFGGMDNSGSFFIDLAGLRGAVEAAVGVDATPMYDLVRPNLEPLDYVAGVTRVEGDAVVSRMGLVLR